MKKIILRCDLKKQFEKFDKRIFSRLEKVFASGRYILGEECRLFEEDFSSYCGVKFGISVANGTEALYLSLRSLGITEGDEVVTSPFSPVPTVSAIVMSGANPVFVDINRDDFLMNLDNLEQAITRKTKAIMPIHLFGVMVDMEKLLQIARKYRLFIVEDACQAHGSAYKGKKSGAWGDLGCFSFYPTKNLGGYGDGGMVITNNPSLAKKLRLLRDYGRNSLFTSIMPGINSRLDEIQAAILRIKLRSLDKLNKTRKKLAGVYISRLKNTPLCLPIPAKSVDGNYHIFAVRCIKKRDALRSYLEKKRIQTNVYYPISMHLQKAYRYLSYKKGDFPISEKTCKEAIALPLYPELEVRTVEFISNKIIQFFKGK